MSEKQSVNMEKKSMICINCPIGCRINAERTESLDWSISGNECRRGESYVLQELTNPLRVLTALMRPEGTEKPLSVKTDRPVPKAKLMECAAQIYKTHPELPIDTGDVIIEDLCGTGARVIAKRRAK